MKKTNAPDRGDIIFLDFAPTKGHEQDGRRTAFVVSPKLYNAKSGLVLVCPITSKKKGYPFEVSVTIKKIVSVVIADQVRSVDWKFRSAKKIGKADPHTTSEVLKKVQFLIE
ncbi:MAG: mRNA-degrading endonuclease [Parcubacteria group bacterium CG11_big_fil_rev_8_21_14_0_20_39_22]|nr:MAG: mRNA-degrading endonuclease [Parcubacteria group bacterium CG11_big_fil_rev_8_21_14_0_20_39_22]